MGVDYYACEHCGETFPDCGEYMRCERGHMIGPCCFHLLGDCEDDKFVDDSDYGCDTIKEEFCPVCKAGGTTEQRLEAAMKEIEMLKATIARLEKRNGG